MGAEREPVREVVAEDGRTDTEAYSADCDEGLSVDREFHVYDREPQTLLLTMKAVKSLALLLTT